MSATRMLFVAVGRFAKPCAENVPAGMVLWIAGKGCVSES